jgi:group I intron endonuclease
MKTLSKYPKDAGVYKLTCTDNGKIYIGKSFNIFSRLGNYRRYEKKPKGRYYFENAIIKYGWDSFTVEILETFKNFDKVRDKDLLFERESYYIKLYNSTNTDIGYNICSYSTDRTGVKSSEEARKNISRGQLGRVHSEETKEKLRQAKLGKPGHPHSEETKEKLRSLNIGKKISEETKEKLRKVRLGTKHSEETKLKMSIVKHGNTNALGFKHSEKTKEKLKQARLRNGRCLK